MVPFKYLYRNLGDFRYRMWVVICYNNNIVLSSKIKYNHVVLTSRSTAKRDRCDHNGESDDFARPTVSLRHRSHPHVWRRAYIIIVVNRSSQPNFAWRSRRRPRQLSWSVVVRPNRSSRCSQMCLCRCLTLFLTACWTQKQKRKTVKHKT